MKKNTAEKSTLGQTTDYCQQYDASLLFAIPRQENRDELGFDLNTLPFVGLDIWTAYEVSWLNAKGKPIVRIVEFSFSADAPNLIESKSFKLYLNSFNGTRFDSEEEVISLWETDLAKISGGEVYADVRQLNQVEEIAGAMPGECLDDLDVEINDYQINPQLLTTEAQMVEETLNSNLLKSNCLVTGQPDWGSVLIRYQGQKINQTNLLKYLISFRNHNEFHEQCVERIFTDIMQQCQPEKLTVYARYVRRGGLDINPYRSNFENEFDLTRLARQ
jgi:7-cyano-7-deazaguanine reductase